MAQDGVTFDGPGNSPAQKEYAIPLDQARNEASGAGDPSTTAPSTASTPSSSGSTSNPSSSSTTVPLFGQGVGDDVAAAAKSRGKSSPGGAKAASGSAPSSVDSALASTRAATAVTGRQGGGALTIGAVAFAVLLLGGVLGSIANRRSRS